MKFTKKAFAVVLMALPWLFLPACQKKRSHEAAQAELREAGYQFTPEGWFLAAGQNDAAALKRFHAAKFPTDTRNAAGDSALHEAARTGAEAAADYLLKCGLGIDLRGADDRTPLMNAVVADQTAMVRWLLRQGADPKLKDKSGSNSLMLAVQEGRAGSVGELAPYDRENLDSALLLAALVGKASVIDALTNYGASVYAKMDDGRTALMIAAENGHAECVTLLLELGATRLATDPEGQTAADIALTAGFPEIAAQLNRAPLPGELSLESPTQIAATMEHFVDEASAPEAAAGNAQPPQARPSTTTRSLAGVTLSPSSSTKNSSTQPTATDKSERQETSLTPLVMRTYREREVPIKLVSVQGETATLTIPGARTRELKVKVGDTIPGSPLIVVRVERRLESSKVNPGGRAEISTLQVRDRNTGNTREWIAGVPARAHDPVALVEDSATGERYLAAPGQRFKCADGAEYSISDVRPNQMVIQEMATGAVQTIPLRGPRG
jgi:ankyrin repeat protein